MPGFQQDRVNHGVPQAVMAGLVPAISISDALLS